MSVEKNRYLFNEETNKSDPSSLLTSSLIEQSNKTNKIKVIGTLFESLNKFGDFYWMIQNPLYNKSLFIFNDNEEYHYTSRKGKGNACIRVFNKYSNLPIPRSAGIPTGKLSTGGYTELNQYTKNIIDSTINEIKSLILKYKYDTIYFSSNSEGKLGTSLFNVSSDVINYITDEIIKLEI
jgi:hypothetical protein